MQPQTITELFTFLIKVLSIHKVINNRPIYIYIFSLFCLLPPLGKVTVKLCNSQMLPQEAPFGMRFLWQLNAAMKTDTLWNYGVTNK